MIQFRLRGGALVDIRFPGAALKLPFWSSALVMLIAAAAVAIALVFGGFGLFAALRIAHGYASSVERSSAATPLAASARQRKPSGSADRLIPAPIAPPVVASSDPAENEPGIDTAKSPSEPAAAHGQPGEIVAGSEPSAIRTAESARAELPPGVSGVPAAGMAADSRPNPAALTAPASKSEAAPPSRAKPHHAVKRHAVRKRVRRVAHRPAYSGAAASPFQPMFNYR